MGADIPGPTPQASTAMQCLERCQAVSACAGWTYEPTFHSCYLKDDTLFKFGFQPTSEMISGLRFCTSKSHTYAVFKITD